MGFTNNRYIVKSPYEYGTLASSAVGNSPFVRICSTVSNTTVTLRNAAGDTIGSVLMGNAGDSIVIEKDVNETLSTNLPVYATGEGAGVLPPPMFIVTPANIDPEQGTGSFTVLHMGEPGTYYWTINNITTSNADFAAVSGSFTTTTVHGTGTFNITTVADLSTEGTQTFTVSVRSGSTSGTILATSDSVAISDTSLTPTITPATNSVDEGSSLSFAVTNLGPNGTYYFTINNITTANADFDAVNGSFSLTGGGAQDNGTGSFSLSTVAERITEGDQTFTVSVRSGSISGPVIVTSGSITLNDISLTPAFTVTPASINEGSSGSFTVNNLGAAGTYYWTILNGTTVDADFSSVSGSFNTATLNGNGSFNITTIADSTTEGDQTFQVQIRTGSTSGTILVTSGSVTVNDTSLTPAFTVTPASINEGSSGSFTVNNLGAAGTYYYTILNGTTVNADFDAVSGSFNTATLNGNGTFTITTIADNTTEGDQTFQVQIRTGSTSGTVILTSSSVTVNDTSLTPAFTVTPASINEGSSGSFTVNNLGAAGTYYWTINNITTANADFNAVSGSFNTATLNGNGTFNITTIADNTTEGNETFTVSVRSGSTSGTILVTSGSVTVNDTSLTPAAIGDVAGLYRTTYTGYFADDPTFFATATVNATAVNLSPIRDGDPGFEPFSTQHLGYFKPATTETYTFYLTSDDASFMWLGANAVSGFNTGNALINNGGVHGSNEVSASIALTAGVYYPIRIQYGDQSGGDVLDFEFSTPTITKDENVTGLIFYNSTTNGH